MEGSLEAVGAQRRYLVPSNGLLGGGGTWWVLAGKTQGRKTEKVFQVKKHHLWSPSGEELQVREGQEGTWMEERV